MIATGSRVAAVVAEALAVACLAEWIATSYRAGERDAVHALAFVCVALFGWAVPQVLCSAGLGERSARLTAAGTGMMLLYGLLRFEFAGDFAVWDFGWLERFITEPGEVVGSEGRIFLGGVFMIAVWARAEARGPDFELESLPRVLAVPFLLVTAALILGAGTSRSGEIARVGAGFYAVAVLALAMSQLALSGATYGELRAGGTAAVLAGVTLGATAVAVLVFWVLFGLAVPYIGPAFERTVRIVVLVVIYPPAWLLDQFFRLIFSGAGVPEVVREVTERDVTELAEDDSSRSTFARVMGSAVRAFALLIGLIVAGTVIAWFARSRRRRAVAAPTNETSVPAGSLGDDAGGLFGALFGRRRKVGVRGSTPARRLYAEALAASERAGAVRDPATTPHEFARNLGTAVPEPLNQDITALFEESRYSGREPDPERVRQLSERWKSQDTRDRPKGQV